MNRGRLLLACASVALVVAVIAIATPLGPPRARPWLIASGLLAVIASIQSVASDPRDLAIALFLSLPPVVALVAAGSPTWLVGPLAVLLLVAGELNALSWDCQGPGGVTAAHRARLLGIVPLAALGLAGSLAVGLVATGPAANGALWLGLAAITLVVLTRVVFGPRDSHP